MVRKSLLNAASWVMWLGLAAAVPVVAQNHLGGNTVLIVRHAEKPPVEGASRELTELGRKRAVAYVKYFRPFHDDGIKVSVTALFAGADSEGSIRPRLTLEPLSKATGMALDTSVGTKEPGKMVQLLRIKAHGNAPLICWRHGQIPALLEAFGASAKQLLPGGKWPDETFDWVVVLQFDRVGRLVGQKLVKETLHVE